MSKQDTKIENAHYWLQWQVALEKCFMDLLKKQETFTTDDFFALASKLEAPATCLKRAASSFVKTYLAQGYISKTGKYQLSTRVSNRSKPIMVYKSNRFGK